jgi:WD40 repeat protein
MNGNPWASVTLVVCWLGLAAVVPAAGPDEAEVARLIRQLGSDEFAQREAAQTRLEELGEAVLPQLRKGVDDADPEIRRRVRRLVEQISRKLYVELRRFEGHDRQVSCMALSADGKRLLTGGLDQTLRLWDVELGRELRSWKDLPGGVWAVAISPDGKRGFFGCGMTQTDERWIRGTDFRMRLWDLENGKELRVFEGHTNETRAAAISPNARYALSAGLDHGVRLWDLDTGKEVRTLAGHTGAVWSVAFSPDSKQAVTSSRDGTVRLWEVETGKELRIYRGHSGEVMSACFTAGGRRILSGGADTVLRLWDAATGEDLRKFEGHGTVIWSVASSADGRFAVTGAGCRARGDGYYTPAGVDYEVRLWDLETGAQVYPFGGHTGSVMTVAFVPDSRSFLSGGSDRTVRLWTVGPSRKK